MASCLTMPAPLVGEPGIVNIPSSTLSSLLCLFSLKIELLHEFLHLLLMIFIEFPLHLHHLFSDLIRLILVILGDLLLQDHAADGTELVDLGLDFVDGFQRGFLEAEWLRFYLGQEF
jgi:hypothetical protein